MSDDFFDFDEDKINSDKTEFKFEEKKAGNKRILSGSKLGNKDNGKKIISLIVLVITIIIGFIPVYPITISSGILENILLVGVFISQIIIHITCIGLGIQFIKSRDLTHYYPQFMLLYAAIGYIPIGIFQIFQISYNILIFIAYLAPIGIIGIAGFFILMSRLRTIKV